jgi:hypothetical protein
VNTSEKWELGLVVSTATNNLYARKRTSVFHCQNVTYWKYMNIVPIAKEHV